MNGQTRVWRAGRWLRDRLITDVDQHDPRLLALFEGPRSPVAWARPERTRNYECDGLHLEIWTITFRRVGAGVDTRAYVVDATLWTTDQRKAAYRQWPPFFQTTSWWVATDALSHFEALRNTLSTVAR